MKENIAACSSSHKPFSVSMCVYGGDDPVHFQTAVDSILNQTAAPDEVVLVVDGPVSAALDTVIWHYEIQPCFRVIRLAANQGHGNARRTGLNACKNELVAIMDADDISSADRFQKQLLLFETDDALDVVGGVISEFIGDTKKIVCEREVFLDDAAIREDLKRRCPMNLVSVMFKKASVEQVGGFIDWFCEEDYYLWARMLMAGMKFANVPDTVVNVRTGDDMYRRRGGREYFKSEAKLQMYLYSQKIINFPTYIVNVGKRLIVQVLLPNWLRGWVFRKFAREKA